MGFPVGYTELMLPKVILHVVFFLGHLRRLITWGFDLFGLAGLLRDSSDIPPSPTAFSPPPLGAATHHRQSLNTTNKPFFAVLIQAALPATTYRGEEEQAADDGCFCCVVCLHEFSSGDEVRRLINCRHVFHRCCLDPWIELDQRTCPLCRTPLVPDRLKDDIHRNLLADSRSASDTDSSSSHLLSSAAAASSYFYYDNYIDDGGDLYDESFGFVLPSTQSEPFPSSSTAVPL